MTIGRRHVVFDLWGTLVPSFPRSAHVEAMHRCSAILGLDPARAHADWVDTFPRRVRGEIPTIERNFEIIAERTSTKITGESLRDAVAEYVGWTRRNLAFPPGVVAALRDLQGSGYRLGLVTNCAPDVPMVLEVDPLRELFDKRVYSCAVHAVKPEPAIYLAALTGLGCAAEDAIYVGDGSDNELTGATKLGMRAVLVTTDLSNAYDTMRPDVESWTGSRIASVSMLTSEFARSL